VPSVRVSLVLDTRDVASIASYQNSCVKEETLLEAMVLAEKASMVINLKMKHSQYRTQSQVNVISGQYTNTDNGIITT